jgi:tetratricopeptide (TPR) repeat protein
VRRRTAGALLVLVAVTLAVYAPTLGHGFVWDDHEQVVDNQRLRTWSSFPDFWREDVLALSRPGEGRSNYYRPLFYTQYLVYYQLFGANPLGWHALAILHHLAACLAAWLLVLRLGFAREVGFWTALLFSVHPAHGESVAWVAAAFNDPPAATLILLGLAAWAGWRRRGGAGSLALAALAYAAALLLKESALAMLALVPLVDWFLARGGEEGGGDAADPPDLAPRLTARRRLAGYLPFAVVTLLYFLLRTATIGTALGVYQGGPTLDEVVPTYPLLALFYLRLLLGPWGLAPSYPLRYLDGWADPAAWGSLLALAALAAAGWWWTRRRPVLRFAGLWVAASVWPVFNTRSFRPTYLAHQRYLYLAVLGLALGIAWGAWAAAGAWATRRRAGAAALRPATPVRRRAAPAAWAARGSLAAVVVVWGASAAYHDRFWASDEALWRRITAVDPGNAAGFDWLGARAIEAGDLDRAEALFRRSIAADPGAPLGWRNLAVLFHTRRDRPDLALPLYERALAAFVARRSPLARDYVECRLNHGAALAAVGREDEALAVFLAVAAAPPHPPDAARNAAVLLARRGEFGRATEALAAGLRHHPGEAHLLAMLGDLERRAARAPAAGPGDPAPPPR